MKRAEFGLRSNGTYGLSISPPGVDVSVANSRKLFTTDCNFVQILFETQMSLFVERRAFTTSSPYGSVTDYVFTGYNLFTFPRTLPFVPEINVMFYETKDSTPNYEIASANTGSRSLSYAATTTQVEIFASLGAGSSTTIDQQSVYLSVLNIPWDA